MAKRDTRLRYVQMLSGYQDVDAGIQVATPTGQLRQIHLTERDLISIMIGGALALDKLRVKRMTEGKP